MDLNAWYYRWLLIGLLFLSLSGCASRQDESETIEVWAHSGQESERLVLQEQVARFNAKYPQPIKLTFIPEGNYNAQVQAASLSGDLPCLLEFDGPFLYNYVWQRILIPLDTLISPKIRQDLLPSIVKQGSYQGHLYSVGTFDSGLGLYGRRSLLEAAEVRIPESNVDAWNAAEFTQVLAKLAKGDRDGQVLDLKLNYGGEWITYAFSPLIQSAGADLIDRHDFQSADGMINSPQSVASMKQLQSWINLGYVDPNLDDAAFKQARVALAWGGHWIYQDYAEALGDDLVLLPLPNFGKGSRTGQGSWNWGMTKTCPNPQIAAQFLSFILSTQEVLAMANANGAVPATKSAIALSPLYGEGTPLRLFAVQLLSGQTVARPQTPAYPVITSVFQQTFKDILNGLDVQTALDNAATIIDIDIQDNQGYPNASIENF